MWTAIKVFFSGALKQVLATLIPWLKTEAAKFVAELLPDAKEIVTKIALQSELSNREKFETAARLIAHRARELGYEYKDSYINQLVEIAYGVVKEQIKPVK
jgi:hypothetical protein